VFLIEDGKVALLSRYHTAIDQNKIISNFSELKSQAGSNIVINSLGATRPRPIAYKAISLAQPCTLLLASDGLMDIVDQDELGQMADACVSAAAICDAILAKASTLSPPDNYSGVLVQIADPELK
jgi:serine/threonine protein phosphatase PrpC